MSSSGKKASHSRGKKHVILGSRPEDLLYNIEVLGSALRLSEDDSVMRG
ncbi:MAG: hypothetical protein ACD_69C00066G0009 [uncultured bacterium]|nr:MAG: hypothetical protein ACD_69C00066G0009 [uncultured bacterium]